MSRPTTSRITHAEAVHMIARAQRKPISRDHLNADMPDGDALIDNGTITVRHRTEREVRP